MRTRARQMIGLNNNVLKGDVTSCWVTLQRYFPKETYCETTSQKVVVCLFVSETRNRCVKKRYIIHTLYRCIKVNLCDEGPLNFQFPKKYAQEEFQDSAGDNDTEDDFEEDNDNAGDVDTRPTKRRERWMYKMYRRYKMYATRGIRCTGCTRGTRGGRQPGIATAVDNIPYRCHHVICTHVLCTFYILLIKS